MTLPKKSYESYWKKANLPRIQPACEKQSEDTQSTLEDELPEEGSSCCIQQSWLGFRELGVVPLNKTFVVLLSLGSVSLPSEARPVAKVGEAVCGAERSEQAGPTSA